MANTTFYLNAPLEGMQPADWLRKHAKPMLTVSASVPRPWIEYLRNNELPCIIVRNSATFKPVGVLASDGDLHRWVREDQAGRWVAFYAAPLDKLSPLLPGYFQAHLARQINITGKLRLIGDKAAS